MGEWQLATRRWAKRHNAICFAQKMWKLRQARRVRKEETKKHRAAICIQRIWRGWHVRCLESRVQERHCSHLFPESLMRSACLLRAFVAKTHSAAVSIRKAWGHIACSGDQLTAAGLVQFRQLLQVVSHLASKLWEAFMNYVNCSGLHQIQSSGDLEC